MLENWADWKYLNIQFPYQVITVFSPTAPTLLLPFHRPLDFKFFWEPLESPSHSPLARTVGGARLPSRSLSLRFGRWSAATAATATTTTTGGTGTATACATKTTTTATCMGRMASGGHVNPLAAHLPTFNLRLSLSFIQLFCLFLIFYLFTCSCPLLFMFFCLLLLRHFVVAFVVFISADRFSLEICAAPKRLNGCECVSGRGWGKT